MPAFASRIIVAISVVASLAVALAGGAWAGDIYKWTDDEGNVHYGDRPAPDGSSRRLAIESSATDHERVAARLEPRREAREAREEERAEAEEAAASEEEERQAEAERAEKCATYKERLQKFLQSRRLYREDENGERVYLDEEEMLAARDQVQDRVEEYCGSGS